MVNNRVASSLAARLAVLGSQLAYAQEKSHPIVDMRFDGPDRQIQSSMGDEARADLGGDNVLYTGNNDGTSFGGIQTRAIAFGKLKSCDPLPRLPTGRSTRAAKGWRMRLRDELHIEARRRLDFTV